jgi:hypothetical protein
MLPVSDEQVAQHLGLTDLRVGAGRVDGAEADSPRVLAWWAVSVNSSGPPGRDNNAGSG